MLTMAGFALSGLWLAVGIEGYAFAGDVVTDGPSNPLMSEVYAPAAGLPPMPRGPGSSSRPCWAFLGTAMAIRGLRSGSEVGTLCGPSSASSG
jgi:cytochrome d ubiquinol oxidase subunit II